MKIRFVFSALVVTALLLMTTSAGASPQFAPIGWAFTYQGRLTDGSNPANGVYDFEFKLYNDPSLGDQVGSPVEMNDVTVAEGLFTVQLDFGNVFDGTALYLQIGVRPGTSADPYTPLSPRQPLTTTPYAAYSAKAPWGGLTGVPAGFADGVDNNTTYSQGTGLILTGNQFSVDTGVIQKRVSSSCTVGNAIRSIDANGNVTCESVAGGTTYTAGDGLQLTGNTFSAKGTPYQNVVIVAKSGGDFTSIQAALNSIIDASAANRYLVWVGPGVYSEQLTMKSYVDIEGAGELTTRITYAGSASLNTGTVVAADYAEVRFLTVENTGGQYYATAVYDAATASSRLTHVTAKATGATGATYGVHNFNSGGIERTRMTDLLVDASGGQGNYGVYNDSSGVAMTNVTVTASTGTSALAVYSFSSALTMMNVNARAWGASNSNRGVFNESADETTMNEVVATAATGNSAIGVLNWNSSPAMRAVTAEGSGSPTENDGVWNHSSSPTMLQVTARASGGTKASGVYNATGSNPMMTDVIAIGSGASSEDYGVYNDNSAPTMTGVTATSYGGDDSAAVFNYGSDPLMTNVTATAYSGATASVAVRNVNGASPIIQNSSLSGLGGTENYGIFNDGGGSVVTVSNSEISGITNTIYNNAGVTLRVGASGLNGGAALGGGFTCAGVYDENFTFYTNTCP